MRTGWKEVARLGMDGARYPHVLVDPHGWCLRLGPDPRRDEKYYSGLPTLLQGAVEQGVRRSLMTTAIATGLEELRRQVQRAIQNVTAQRETLLQEIARQSPIKRLSASEEAPEGPGACWRSLSSVSPIPARKESL